jgi:hypothetical protein
LRLVVVELDFEDGVSIGVNLSAYLINSCVPIIFRLSDYYVQMIFKFLSS